MIDLYNIDDAFLILNKKKRFVFLLIASFIVLLCLIVGITWLSDSYFIMIIDIILTTIYLWVLYTYLFYFRKVYNEEYHFLAKVEQYQHEELNGVISYLDKEITTIKNMEVYTLKVNGRIVYFECSKIPSNIDIDTNVKFIVMDNFVIGYEVL
jgi:ABC-type multidrug transport system fused ATPase/permease subunit